MLDREIMSGPFEKHGKRRKYIWWQNVKGLIIYVIGIVTNTY